MSAIENHPLALARVEQIERDLDSWAARPVEFPFPTAGSELFSMMELAHSYAKRCSDFAKSIRTLIAENRIIPATVLARALIETVAMGCFYLHEMARLIADGDRERVDARLSRFYAGFKGKTPVPVHVMDAMRHLEKVDGDYVTYLDDKYGLLTRFLDGLKALGDITETTSIRDQLSAMKNYDLLSEVAHPNGLGTQFLYPDGTSDTESVSKVRARFRFASLMAIWQCHHLIGALEDGATLPERYRDAFLKQTQR